jgi:nitroreductase
MYDLEQAINDRHSTRMFVPDKPVPRELVDQALELAIRAPSNSNVQPWHVRLVSGVARDRLVAALLAEATSKPPVVPELPELFAHMRRDLGAKVYGSMGITRDDTGPPDRGATQLGVLPRTTGRYRLHAPRPPLHRQRRRVPADLLLALTARGLGTCVQVSIAGYPEIVRDQLNIPQEYAILSVLAIG